jgi:hypothetical protein
MDVHAPTEPIHTWKDFFLHLITITIGLLIALSLEAGVEWMHHRHEVKETREALRIERDHNRQSFARNTSYFRAGGALIQNNLLVLVYLQQHPGTTEDKLPGIVVWGAYYEPITEATWKTAQQTNVTALMPQDEVTKNDALYSDLEQLESTQLDLFRAVTRAQKYSFVDPDITHLTPAQLDNEIEFTKDVLEANYRRGVWLQALNKDFPDFMPAPSMQEILTPMHFVRSEEERKKLAAAQAITANRVKQAFTAAAAPPKK